MPNCVTISWPRAPGDTPPTRETFQVCQQTGQTLEQFRADVHAAIDQHWAAHPPIIESIVLVEWGPSISFNVHAPEGVDSLALFLVEVHSHVNDEWDINPPQ